MEPVRVLGGGLSGLATAVLLARRGRVVEVRDRRPKEGRFAGGFQVLENATVTRDVVEELGELGFGVDEVVEPLREAVLVDSRMQRYPVRSVHPYAYLTRRGRGSRTLDQLLLGCARELGVRLDEGRADATWQPDVIATGPQRADGVSREMTFTTGHHDLIVVHFDPRLTPTGYSYLFVRDGLGTVGAAQVRRVAELRKNARRAFQRLFELYPMTVDDPSERARYMNFGIPGGLERDGVWYVGEAAGVQDFLFGLGNRLAFRSAALVADGMTEAGWDEEAFCRDVVMPMTASVLGRAVFEVSGTALTARFCRWLASDDFRDRLLAAQRSTAVRRIAARAVMAAWGSRGCCGALPLARWCRRRER